MTRGRAEGLTDRRSERQALDRLVQAVTGGQSRSLVVRGKRRCRMHGGAAGSGAPVGNKNAFRHGHYSAEAIARRRQLSELIRIARDTLAELK